MDQTIDLDLKNCYFFVTKFFCLDFKIATFFMTADVSYEGTARYHFPVMSQRNVTGFNNATSVKELAQGPFGFEEAVGLEKDQVICRLKCSSLRLE